jgi:hypothetical protein
MSSPIPFYKYHALGNDYIVLNPAEAGDCLQIMHSKAMGILMQLTWGDDCCPKIQVTTNHTQQTTGTPIGPHGSIGY